MGPQKLPSDEGELLEAEIALVEAESAWFGRPGPDTAAEYLHALETVVEHLVQAGLDDLSAEELSTTVHRRSKSRLDKMREVA